MKLDRSEVLSVRLHVKHGRVREAVNVEPLPVDDIALLDDDFALEGVVSGESKRAESALDDSANTREVVGNRNVVSVGVEDESAFGDLAGEPRRIVKIRDLVARCLENAAVEHESAAGGEVGHAELRHRDGSAVEHDVRGIRSGSIALDVAEADSVVGRVLDVELAAVDSQVAWASVADVEHVGVDVDRAAVDDHLGPRAFADVRADRGVGGDINGSTIDLQRSHDARIVVRLLLLLSADKERLGVPRTALHLHECCSVRSGLADPHVVRRGRHEGSAV